MLVRHLGKKHFADEYTVNSWENNMNIFLSHAASNHDIADLLCTLLGDGLNITRENIFCSSLPGQTIPGGFDFVKHVKDQLTSADTVICLLSENYIDSQFCMAELGASWILSKKTIPLIVPPLTFEDVRATLALTQAWEITKSSGLNSMADDLFEEGIKAAQWGVSLDKFIEKIVELIEIQPKPEKVLFCRYEQTETKLKAAESAVDLKDKEISRLKEEISELKKCKDKSEVDKTEKRIMSEFDKFNVATNSIKNILSNVPRIVEEAIYYENKGDNLPLPAPYDDDRKEDMLKAKNSGLLMQEEDEPIYVNYAHPKLNHVKEYICDLHYILESLSPEFRESIEDDDIVCSLDNIDFWDKYLF